MIIYLAGKMSGCHDWNHPAFHAAEAALTAQGYIVLSPARTDGGSTDKPRPFYMRAAFELLLQADGIALLPGWNYSYGANLEYRVARELGLAFYEYWDGELCVKRN